jgi:REP element-mobilizing transposase RayT
MPQSLSAVHVHFVFSTRDRRPFLAEQDHRARLHAYLGGILTKLACPPIAIGGIADHVHVLARLGRSASQAEVVKELKRASTMWIKAE